MSTMRAARSASPLRCCRRTRREAYAAEVRAEYAKISAAHFRAQADKKRLRLADARANAVAIDFANNAAETAGVLRHETFREYDLAELADYIDWTPFFQTWELTGRYPAILDDANVGEAARSLYDDARKMLDRIIREKWFTAQATIGFWPANAQGDDIARLCGRDARQADRDPPHACASSSKSARGASTPRLSDFIAPRDERHARLYRRLRGHRRHRRRRGGRPFQECQRRLLLDPVQGTGRSPRGSLCRAHACASAPRVLGLCAG